MDRVNEIRHKPGLRNLSGLSYAWDCAIPHWAGFAMILAGLLGIAFGEYFIRVPIEPGPYLPNAFFAMLGPFLMLAWADWYSIRTYRAICRELRTTELRSILLDPLVIDGLRRDLYPNIILRWFAPPPLRTVRVHAAVVVRWYSALKLPEGTALGRRLREVKIALWIVLLPMFLGLPLLVFSLTRHQPLWQIVGQPRESFGWALLLIAFSFIYAGYTLMRFAARKQAVQDYFALWKTESQANG